MIFGDEPRECSVSSKKNKIYGMISQTEGHVGPGAYFTSDSNVTSSLNTRKNHSVKQPMAQGLASKASDRSFLISSGILTPLGVAMPGPAQAESTPGPGHYAGVTSPQFKPRPSPGSSPGPGSMGTSPRLTRSNSIIKNGVMFEGGSRHQKNSPFGPGHYFVEQDTLNKKSFNARVAGNTTHTSGGAVGVINQSVLSKSPRKSPTRSPLNSPLTPRARALAQSQARSQSQGQGQSQPQSPAGRLVSSSANNSYLFQNSPKHAEEYRQRLLQEQQQLQQYEQAPPPSVFGGMLASQQQEMYQSEQPYSNRSTINNQQPLTVEQLSLEP